MVVVVVGLLLGCCHPPVHCRHCRSGVLGSWTLQLYSREQQQGVVMLAVVLLIRGPVAVCCPPQQGADWHVLGVPGQQQGG